MYFIFLNPHDMKKTILLFLLPLCIISCKTDREEPVQSEDILHDTKYGVVVDGHTIVASEIKAGDYFGGLMYSAGVDENTLQEIIKSSEGIFDIRKIKIGQEYELIYENDSTFAGAADSTLAEQQLPDGVRKASYFVYERDAMSHVLFSLKDSIYAKVIEKEITKDKKYVEVKINTSLWNDVSAAGASSVLALRLADIYAWTIDFFGLQEGDSFKAVYDELSYNGEFIDIDNVYYCEFTHGGNVYKSIRFVDGDKSNVYWNEKGESLRKAFLKAPLNFTRISSRFTYNRLHPIYRVRRPHTGVDYAAPAGTPVVSIGDGVVISKGWGGGGGNTVKIRHNSVYTTAYLHLSRYAAGLKKGQRVKQGEVIGYVGSTGASTGPHLDFRVWKNGTPIDPLKMESPSVEPVSEENMAAFNAVCVDLKNEMDSLATRKYVQRLLEIL